MKTVSKILLIFASALTAFGAAPTWDSSGNSLLNGTYYFRQAIYSSSGGSLSGAYSYYGNISFTGSGTYTITSGTFVEYTSQGPEVNTAATGTGTYSVSASGYGFMTSPLTSANIVFLVSNGIIVGSSTENNQQLNDLFVAAPISTSLSLSSLSGAYTIGTMFPGADATYQLTPNGASTFNVSISGYNSSGAAITQNSSGVKLGYSNGAYTISFPTNTNANFYTGGTPTNSAPFNTGVLFLYSSPDSNFVFGGTQYGFDMFVGVRNTTSSTPISGLYYEAGLENSGGLVDSFYGSFNTASGIQIGHQRILYAGYSPSGQTYSTNYPTSINGSYTDESNTINYTLASNGVRIGYEINGYQGIEVALPYTPPTPPQSVYLDPIGIVNTASSAPYTAGISPGEFLTIYPDKGTGLASTIAAATGGQTFPTTLGGVTILIDGVLQAPIFDVSPTQIDFIVPYEVSTYPIASIQVKNNGVSSNTVTTNVNLTTPGVFTYETGIGDSALLDYPVSGAAPFYVNESNPATGGDVIVSYLTGLGTPFPSNPDGAPGVFDSLVQTINVDISGVTVATPAYLGLAPGEPGLYQINFTLPPVCTASGQTSCVDVGDDTLGITGPDSSAYEALIPVGTSNTAALVSGQAPSHALKSAALLRRDLLKRLKAKQAAAPGSN